MKLLLCTPYNQGQEIVHSGIAVWAQIVLSYYKSSGCGSIIDVVPFDRKTGVDLKHSFIRRFYMGAREYRASIKDVRRKLRNGSYDTLHLCTSASFSLLKDYLLLKMANKHGVKTVIHFHFGRIPSLFNKQNWEWRLLKIVSKLATDVIVIDESSYSTMLKAGFDNVHYLPNPLSDAITSQIEKDLKTIDRERGKILFVGHVLPTKGIYEMVDACKEIPNIRLNIIGTITSDVKDEIIRRVGGLSDWIVFRGALPHETVIKEMLSSQIFVLPSYTEGFPNVILESMACGCGIVATNVGAIPEMLNIKSNNPCGICVSPQNKEELKDAIQSLLNNSQLTMEYGMNAMNRANSEYSISRIWEHLINLWS